MAKFHGNIGYATSAETQPGVWVDTIEEKEYYGEVIREARNWSEREQVNPNLLLTNRISIVADNFAYENFSAMKYVILEGVYWNISSLEILRPRIILSLGGVYNGTKA